MTARAALAAGWAVALALAVGVRGWNSLAGPRMWGYDAWGHVAYVFFLDLYGGVPWADQGWSYFHPPLHYALGAALARFGSGEVLMRGLALLGSAASLGTAAWSAWLARRLAPDRPALPLLAFTAVALLPVHVFMSPMPGNELTQTFLAATALGSFVANEGRGRPSWRLDALTGLLLGLCLLTKFNGALALFAVLGSLGLRAFWRRSEPGEWGRCARRGAIVAGIALALSAPYYARNVAAFGNPFELSRGYPLVAAVERDQPPGRRELLDYVRFPLRAFTDPNPLAPHLVRSVWATLYLNVWADVFRESDVERALWAERRTERSTTWMALLGLAPTGLALAGAVLCARDAWRGRRRALLAPVLLTAAGAVGAFVVFSWRVPIWSALKASYVLGLSLPYGVFLARGALPLVSRGPWVGALPGVAVGLAGLGAVVVGAEGVVLPRRADSPATGAVYFQFGEYDEARRIYGRLVQGAGYKVAWMENLAAVDLAAGEFARARRLYARAVATGLPDPYRPGRLAVATALAGDLAGARRILDDALAAEDLPELRANRGAVRAAAGDLDGALADPARATEAAPEMTPAWLVRAVALERAGRDDEAAAARRRAVESACRAPRGDPYGLGTGEVLEWGVGRRPLLLWDGEALRVALPAFYREACARLRDRSAP